jgi:hypothetical protein
MQMTEQQQRRSQLIIAQCGCRQEWQEAAEAPGFSWDAAGPAAADRIGEAVRGGVAQPVRREGRAVPGSCAGRPSGGCGVAVRGDGERRAAVDVDDGAGAPSAPARWRGEGGGLRVGREQDAAGVPKQELCGGAAAAQDAPRPHLQTRLPRPQHHQGNHQSTTTMVHCHHSWLSQRSN